MGGAILTPSPQKKNTIMKNVTSSILCWNKGNGKFLLKKDEIEFMIDKYKPVIVGILEANMAADIYNPSIQISGYKLEKDNLSLIGEQTRTAVYISDRISYKRRSDLEIINTPLIWLEICPFKAKSWLIGVGYRQWKRLIDEDKKASQSMKSQLERFQNWSHSIRKAEKEGKQLILAGDINIDVTPWLHPEQPISEYQNSKSSLLEALKLITLQQDLHLIKTAPTRFQGNDQPSILDLVITNIPHLISPPILLETSSDHKCIIFNKHIKLKCKMEEVRKARSYKLYTKERLLANLNMPVINQLLFSRNTNYVADSLIGEINSALDICAPVKTTQMRAKYIPHLLLSTKELMMIRNKHREKANTSKSEEDGINIENRKTMHLKLKKLINANGQKAS